MKTLISMMFLAMAINSVAFAADEYDYRQMTQRLESLGSKRATNCQITVREDMSGPYLLEVSKDNLTLSMELYGLRPYIFFETSTSYETGMTKRWTYLILDREGGTVVSSLTVRADQAYIKISTPHGELECR